MQGIIQQMLQHGILVMRKITRQRNYTQKNPLTRRRREVTKIFRPCARWTPFLISASGSKLVQHGINTADTHGIRYTTHRTPHHDWVFGEREADYHSEGQEKE